MLWLLTAAAHAGCSSDADALRAWLTEITTVDGSTLAVSSELHPVERPTGPLIDGSPLVEQLPGRIVVGGQTTTVAGAVAAIRAERERWAPYQPNRPFQWAIDRDTPWSEVVALAGAVGPGDAVLVFARSVTATPPGRSAVTADLDAAAGLPAQDRAVVTVKSLQSTFARCPDALGVFGRLSSTDPGARTQAYVDGLPEALVKCGCAADLPSVRSLSWVLVGPGGGPVVGGLKITLAGTTAALVSQPPSTPWSKANAALTGGGTPISLVTP
jgi:hypothetical protein